VSAPHDAVVELGARQQIHDAVLHYCRGIDRLDGTSVARGFHPGAVLRDYGASPMTIEAFVEHALASLGSRFVATQHRASNTLISFDGDDAASGAALVETYVLAFHVEAAPDGDQLHTFAGRYIDRFTEVDGAWRIAERTLRNDWTLVEPIERRMRGSYVASGRGEVPDPVFATRPG
jgi:SnoaL-like domain